MEKVFITKTRDRVKAVKALLKEFDLRDFVGKRVALKANYNSADRFPASTHLETLSALFKGLKDAGVAEVTLAERSGMGETRNVLMETGVSKLSNQLGFRIVVLDELDKEGWVRFNPSYPNHWTRGFLIAKVFKDADRVVQTCCLKTHRFGGHFTMSLKNSVGLIAKHDPEDKYNYMQELHSSPNQRRMIAEINGAYETVLIIMDALEAFVNGGPESGETVSPDVMLGGRDRVAIDAVGVAILRHFGTTKEVSDGKIFHQQQIARAAELGFGVRSAQDIELVPLNKEGEKFAKKIKDILSTDG